MSKILNYKRIIQTSLCQEFKKYMDNFIGNINFQHDLRRCRKSKTEMIVKDLSPKRHQV